jgi:hypothetical protein
MYHTDKPETKQQLLEYINEAIVAIRNEVEKHQNVDV